MDAFCGVGGNTVHFARRCRHVIGVDTCRPRLELTRHNASVYGVADRLDLLCSDFFSLPRRLQVLKKAVTRSSIPCNCSCVWSQTWRSLLLLVSVPKCSGEHWMQHNISLVRSQASSLPYDLVSAAGAVLPAAN